jgi:hypothetical protein
MNPISLRLTELLEAKRTSNKELRRQMGPLREQLHEQMGWQAWWQIGEDDEKGGSLAAPRLEAHLALLPNNVVESRIVLVTSQRSGRCMFSPVSFAQTSAWQALEAVERYRQAVASAEDERGLLLALGLELEGSPLLGEVRELQDLLGMAAYFFFEGHVFAAGTDVHNVQGGLLSLIARPASTSIDDSPTGAGNDLPDLSPEELLSCLAKEDRKTEALEKSARELDEMAARWDCSIGQAHVFMPAPEDALPAPRVEARVVLSGDYYRETEVVLVLPRGPLRQFVVLDYGKSSGRQDDLSKLPTTGSLSEREVMALPSVINEACFQMDTAGLPAYMVIDEERRYRVMSLRPLALEAV